MPKQHCACLFTLPACNSNDSCRLWCRVSFMLKEARQGSAAANRAAAQAAEQEAAHRRREAQRRLQPRTSADFALLYSELEAWRLAETARIKAAGLSPEDCHQALAHLLHQVSPWLATQLAFTWRMLTDSAENRNQHMQQIVGTLLSWCRMQKQQSSGVGSWFYHYLSLQVMTHSTAQQYMTPLRWCSKKCHHNIVLQTAQ